jgi:hypothetical protein
VTAGGFGGPHRDGDCPADQVVAERPPPRPELTSPALSSPSS